MTRIYSAALALLLAWLPVTAARAQTITSFSPASGNAGTLVTLRGTTLNLVTAVAVNGTAGVILDKTSTALHLLVLPGATSGAITTTGGTSAASATAFSVTHTPLSATQQGPKLVGTGASRMEASRHTGQGWAVALSADGNTLAASEPTDNDYIGATWVFTHHGTVWRQQGPKLVGTGASGTAGQGWSVALSADGNTLAVGGNGDKDNIGATWVFARHATVWRQQGPKLVGTGAIGTAGQGQSVTLSADGSTLAVGGNDDIRYVGATWVFARHGTVWTQQGAKLVGTGVFGTAAQGTSVALSANGTTLAVGGYNDDSGVGATWVFTRRGSVWRQQGPKLVGTEAAGHEVRQGGSVALSADGNTLAVGGDSDNYSVGATWVFTRLGATWTQQGPKLVGTGAVGHEVQQGGSVALSADGTTLAIGGLYDNQYVGASWVFTRRGATWSQQGCKLVGTGLVGNPTQGNSVALSADGTTLAVGGYQDNNEAGATWVFSAASSPLPK